MRWEEGKQSENVEDRRQGPPVGAVAGGGGLLLVVIAVVMYFMGVDPRQIGQLLQQQNQQGAPAAGPGGGPAAGPVREATAEELKSRRFAATILGFTEEVWNEQFQKAGSRYVAPKMVLFSDKVATGCGVAPASIGPFYCPADRTVYLDPTFFDELAGKLGGSKAEFSQAYVIAHEVGHHVQNLLGYSGIVDEKRRTVSEAEANQWSVRLELQADYLAGVWAHHGQKEFNFIEPGDIESAILSANAIGDDRLQKNATGFVSPESFTHGTSAQRVKWFRLGLQTGDLRMLEEIFRMPYERL